MGKSSSETHVQALVRMEVACQLALDSLPKLPPETGERLREPIESLCNVTRDELVRLDPSFAGRFDKHSKPGEAPESA